MQWLRNPTVRKLAATLVLSAAGAAGIVGHEGMQSKVYLDPVGIPTVCAGHTATVTRADVGKTYSAQTCEKLLQADTSAAQSAVRSAVKVPVSQGQYDALVSFTFNVGGGNLRSSTLLRKLNAGDCHGAAAQFPRWNKAQGVVLPGLVTRREAERKMFEADCP